MSDYTLGGPIGRNAIYVKRNADDQLIELCRQAKYGYIFAGRQMGKSSLVMRAVDALATVSIHSSIISLTSIGSQVSQEQWYFSVLDYIRRDLNLGTSAQFESWWQRHHQWSSVQRFRIFFQHYIPQDRVPLVIFLDEVDLLGALAFGQEVIHAIKELHNERLRHGALTHLSFVLIGAISPLDLVNDRNPSWLEIGERIHLTDLSFDRANELATGFRLPPKYALAALKRIFDWTAGHPYLTQYVCSAFAKHVLTYRLQHQDAAHQGASLRTKGLTVSEEDPLLWRLLGLPEPEQSWMHRLCELSSIDNFMRVHFDSRTGRENYNLTWVGSMLVNYRRRSSTLDSPTINEDRNKILDTYAEIRNSVIKKPKAFVRDDETRPEISYLKLTGIVGIDVHNRLRVRNRIYSHVFNKDWIKQSRPYGYKYEKRMQRIRIWIGTFASLVMLAVAVLVGIWLPAKEKLITARMDAEQARFEQQTAEARALQARIEVAQARTEIAQAQSAQAIAEAQAEAAQEKATTAYTEALIARFTAVIAEEEAQIAQDQAATAQTQAAIAQTEASIAQDVAQTEERRAAEYAALRPLYEGASFTLTPGEDIGSVTYKRVIVSPDGLLVAAVSNDKVLHLWQRTSRWGPMSWNWVGQRTWDSEIKSFSFSPTYGFLLVVLADGKSYLWSPITKQEEEVDPFRYTVDHALFSPTPSQPRVIAVQSDRTIELWSWNPKTGLVETTVELGPSLPTDADVRTLRVSHDGQFLAVITPQGVAWSEAWKQNSEWVVISDDQTRDIALNSDGTQIAIAGTRVRIINRENGSNIQTLSTNSPVKYIEFHPDDNRLLTVSDDKTLRTWDVATGQVTGQDFKGSEHKDATKYATFTPPDGAFVITVGNEPGVRVWLFDAKLVASP